jgi:4a-hydroxytetrahydrobiopterin dehydratase
MKLSQKKCVPCEGGVPKLTLAEAESLNSQLITPWTIEDEMKIFRSFAFENFIETMQFVNRVAEIAEEEGHHPVMHVYYAKVDIELWTHAILGLSENDFILAAKIEEIA